MDDTANFTGEKTAGPNGNSVMGYDVIDSIKAGLENSCPGVVSCADIISVAARDSVVLLGGPSWSVLLGRRDSTTASLTAANTNIPGTNSNLNQLISSFSNKGLSTRDLVALSGSHTIGRARSEYKCFIRIIFTSKMSSKWRRQHFHSTRHYHSYLLRQCLFQEFEGSKRIIALGSTVICRWSHGLHSGHL
nr:cationic peroxidase 1-like [Ipomoea batatas]